MFRVLTILAGAVASVALAAPAAAQPGTCLGTRAANSVRLTVVSTDLRNAAGEVAVTVYPDDSRRFLAKKGKLARARVPTRAPETSTCFWVAPGHYAVAMYHDENGDHDFNRTLFSIKEGFGFSNDAPTTLGLPRFERVRFAVGPGDTSIRIKTRYAR